VKRVRGTFDLKKDGVSLKRKNFSWDFKTLKVFQNRTFSGGKGWRNFVLNDKLKGGRIILKLDLIILS